MANYWTISRNDLPSKYVFYGEDAVIKCRLLNIQEIKYLSTVSDESATSIINEILQRCVKFENMNFNDLLIADREWLCFWLRMNSFIDGAGYTIKKQECIRCKKPFEIELSFGSMEIRNIKMLPRPFQFPDTGFVINLHYPTIKDLSIRYKDSNDIEFAARCLPKMNDPVQFVLNLSAADYAALMDEVSNYDIGFNKNITFNCKDPMCNALHRSTLIISDESIFGKVDISGIIERATRIEKYLAVPVNDDIPWMELELKMKVIEKMIKEENDEAEKQQRKANAQAAAARSRANSQSHIHR